MATYYAFRQFLIQSTQRELFEETREAILNYTLSSFLETTRREIVYRNNRYILFTESAVRNLYIFKIARILDFEKPVDVQITIENVLDTMYPYVSLYYSTEYQIFFVNYESEFSTSKSGAAAIFDKFINEYISERSNFIAKSNFITNPTEFWATVASADSVYELSFELMAPNLFEGRFDINDLVNEIKSSTNITATIIRFLNKKGLLIRRSEAYRKLVEYIAAGGGKYLAKLRKDGRSFKYKSNSNPVTVDVNPETNYSEFIELFRYVDNQSNQIS